MVKASPIYRHKFGHWCVCIGLSGSEFGLYAFLCDLLVSRALFSHFRSELCLLKPETLEHTHQGIVKLGEHEDGLGSDSGVRTRSGGKGKMVEQFIRCKFKIAEKYKYSHKQAEVVAFIFGEKKEPHEVLFKRGTRQMDREEFSTVLPGNEPSDYVMELMAYRNAWIQFQLQKTSYRSLFPSNNFAKGRIYAATAVATALDHIIRVGFHQVDILGHKPPLHKWEPEFVLGVANMGNPYKDKLWILLSLQMEQYFSEGTFAKPKSHIDNVANKVRMVTAMALVDDLFNELRVEMKERARKDWDG
ncbi:hypothetical protein PIB30_064771 [Stylosanthes scabra]|uniref:Uncharacterized protein n=1 Tax=Stylosanthes scabra TaxID=79078 RepID=A0ABU6ZKI8_9FABA|nr:hypothetical protein [Stylosanthes scabra]